MAALEPATYATSRIAVTSQYHHLMSRDGVTVASSVLQMALLPCGFLARILPNTEERLQHESARRGAILRAVASTPPPRIGEGAANQLLAQERANSCSLGRRPSGVYLSTASGRLRVSRDSSSSCERPVSRERVASTSGPMACSRCCGAICLLGPRPTHDSAASPCPACLKLSTRSFKPPPRRPPRPAPPKPPSRLSSPPGRPPAPPCRLSWLAWLPWLPCPGAPDWPCPRPPSISASLSLF